MVDDAGLRKRGPAAFLCFVFCRIARIAMRFGLRRSCFVFRASDSGLPNSGCGVRDPERRRRFEIRSRDSGNPRIGIAKPPLMSRRPAAGSSFLRSHESSAFVAYQYNSGLPPPRCAAATINAVVGKGEARRSVGSPPEHDSEIIPRARQRSNVPRLTTTPRASSFASRLERERRIVRSGSR